MKPIILFLLIITALFSAAAQPRYSQVRIPVRSAEEFRRLTALGVATDHFSGKIGTAVDVFVSGDEAEALRANGIPYTVLIPDWERHYAARRSSALPVSSSLPSGAPTYFRYGSMGGFLRYQEMVQQIDSMHLLFPALAAAKDSIGITIEGRPIYAVKISDGVGTHEPGEPEVLYTSLHHAREPQSMMTVIYFMWWLLENYGTDPVATYLVENRQMWFIPAVNPDGVLYNEATNPEGGGMHRKNRRDVGTSNKGVDLNRNYGPHFMWDYPNPLGSSTTPNNDSYRGTDPFSEPETQAVRRFIEQRNIRTCFNYHTYGNYLIYPWGYRSGESDDSILYRYWAYEMTGGSRYTTGTDLETVQYSTRGNSDDYMYSDSGKVPTFAFTPEVGATGFWPTKAEIYPLAEENVHQNVLLAYTAGAFPSFRDFTAEQSAPGVTALAVKVRNIGLQRSGVWNLSAAPLPGGAPVQRTLGAVPSMAESTVVFLIPSVPEGPRAVVVQASDSAGILKSDTLRFYSGTGTVLFHDSAATTAMWNTGSGWGVATETSNGNTYFTDSPAGDYASNANNALTLTTPLDLTAFGSAELTFRTVWEVESTWDFAIVEASSNGGISWSPLRTTSARRGSARDGSMQPATLHGYDGYTPGMTWLEQRADLSFFAGKPMKLRFRLLSDGAIEHDGWSVDDIRITGHAASPQSAEPASAPASFALAQNHPNPFNPSTVISFTLPHAGHTSLRVYTPLGQEAAVITDGFLTAGPHSLIFDARQLSSGVYFYRLTSGPLTSTRKMTLLR